MAERLLLVNPKAPPSKRKRNGNMARKRSAAQRAATKKLVALNRARAGGTAKRRRRNPIKAVAVARPARRARPATRAVPARRPVRRRRNPISAAAPMALLTAAVPGALGAVALDALWANLPLPDAIKTGYVGDLAQGAGAVGVAIAARKIVSRKMADAIGVGALTVIMHRVAKKLVGQVMPGMALGCDTGYSGMGYYPQTNLGYYPAQSLGYINPALPVADPTHEMNYEMVR